jgi:hypothetical protein
MVMKKVSILLPSRGRPGKLLETVDRLLLTAKRAADVEIMVTVDHDDAESMALIDKCCHVVWTVNYQEEKDRTISGMINLMASKARGDWFLWWNDDAWMATQEWDRIAQTVPPGYLGRTLPHVHFGYTEYPVLTRVGMEKLGFLIPPQIPWWGSDPALYRLFDSMKRVVDIPIEIVHNSNPIGSPAYERMKRLSGDYLSIPLPMEKWVTQLHE